MQIFFWKNKRMLKYWHTMANLLNILPGVLRKYGQQNGNVNFFVLTV